MVPRAGMERHVRRDDAGVRIDVGPISRASAVAWLDYADEALVDLRRAGGPSIPAGALDGFAALVREWRAVAAREDPFRWTVDLPPERVEYLIRALYEAGLVIERESEAHRARLRPREADEFHLVLVDRVLGALEQESPSNAQFVEAMRAVWRVARDE